MRINAERLPMVLLIGFAGATAAAPVNYTIEPVHTCPSFEAPHLGISWWRGKFLKTSGKATLDRDALSGTVEVNIDPASIDFGNPKLNEHARSKDFFNVEQFPKVTYTGSSIRFDGSVPVEVDGSLTLLGVTRPLKLAINSFKCIQHPMFKREACGADAYGTFKRSDFGMSYGVPVHGDEVKLRIQVELLQD